MAEGVTVGDNVVCRFFATSVCKDGPNCLFSHDRSKHILDNVCRFYLQGRCIYGSYCRYDHVKIQPKNKKTDGGKHKPGRNQVASNRRSSNHPGTDDWIHAPEFVPRSLRSSPQSYAEAVKPATPYAVNGTYGCQQNAEELLCPYFVFGDCVYGENCSLIHGEECDICHKRCLLPFDDNQKKNHRDTCCKELEKDMEESFAIQRSIDKTCGICFDVIMKKHPISDRRFGILEKCNHIFCLKCIRTWRKLKNTNVPDSYDPEVTRTCPECRVASDFVTPSKYWIDSVEEKQKLIKEYKEAMSKKPCQYFKQGRGSCPFGGACFYLHAKPDGTKVMLPPPVRRPRIIQDGELDFAEEILLRNFLDLQDEVMFSFEYDEMYLSDSDSDRSYILD